MTRRPRMSRETVTKRGSRRYITETRRRPNPSVLVPGAGHAPLQGTASMNRFLLILVVLLVALIGGGFVVMASLDVRAPEKHIEKVIPDARLPR